MMSCQIWLFDNFSVTARVSRIACVTIAVLSGHLRNNSGAFRAFCVRGKSNQCNACGSLAFDTECHWYNNEHKLGYKNGPSRWPNIGFKNAILRSYPRFNHIGCSIRPTGTRPTAAKLRSFKGRKTILQSLDVRRVWDDEPISLDLGLQLILPFVFCDSVNDLLLL
jgi:hypothetical protein